MVKAIVDIDEDANKVLNHLKAEYCLKDKSQAINLMAKEFNRFVRTGPEIRPEYVEKLKRIQRGKHMIVKDFAKEFGLK